MSQTIWKIDGTDLRNLAYNIIDVDGWDSWPGRRGRNREAAYVHGEGAVARKFIPARDLALRMTILASDSSGNVTKDPLLHVQENIDTLLGLLWKPNSLLTVTRQIPGGDIRTVQAEAIDASDIRPGIGSVDREFLVRLRLPDPFWSTPATGSPASKNVTTTTDTLAITTGGNAPIGDASILFAATADVQNPRIEWTPPGATDPEFLQYSGTINAGDSVDFRTGRRVALFSDGSRADAGASFGYPWWLELTPQTAITFDLSCTVASDWTATVTWNDKWF